MPTPTKRCAPRSAPWWRRSTPACRRGTRRSSIPPGPTYARALHQELAAAGVAVNGPGTRRLDRSVAGATLLGLLELAASDWGREEVMAWLATAPIVSGPERRRVPASRWDSAVLGRRRGARRRRSGASD